MSHSAVPNPSEEQQEHAWPHVLHANANPKMEVHDV